MLRYTKEKILKGKYTPDGPPRNELVEEEQEIVQYYQVHHADANGEDDYADDDEFASVKEGGDEGGDEKCKQIWCNMGHVDSSATG